MRASPSMHTTTVQLKRFDRNSQLGFERDCEAQDRDRPRGRRKQIEGIPRTRKRPHAWPIKEALTPDPIVRYPCFSTLRMIWRTPKFGHPRPSLLEFKHMSLKPSHLVLRPIDIRDDRTCVRRTVSPDSCAYGLTDVCFRSFDTSYELRMCLKDHMSGLQTPVAQRETYYSKLNFGANFLKEH
ncbi:hypothetical protein CC86DRAFT_178804 [Ophiobolus disseminans]|uniref:Uncharacterized protein n=1 Tax=Ophiobolus disseminans TaxID=1469910 RepID=A0A6A7ABA2_9PLEO|nr:hypothetical protein CC86DRAFT_178804 [Ophiobolus disseminans]